MEFIPQVLFAQMPVLKHEQAVCDQQAVGKADRQNYDGNLPLTQLVDQMDQMPAQVHIGPGKGLHEENHLGVV